MALNQVPSVVQEDAREVLRQQAIDHLLAEVQAGRESVHDESDLISEEDLLKRLGIRL